MAPLPGKALAPLGLTPFGRWPRCVVPFNGGWVSRPIASGSKGGGVAGHRATASGGLGKATPRPPSLRPVVLPRLYAGSKLQRYARQWRPLPRSPPPALRRRWRLGRAAPPCRVSGGRTGQSVARPGPLGPPPVGLPCRAAASPLARGRHGPPFSPFGCYRAASHAPPGQGNGQVGLGSPCALFGLLGSASPAPCSPCAHVAGPWVPPAAQRLGPVSPPSSLGGLAPVSPLLGRLRLPALARPARGRGGASPAFFRPPAPGVPLPGQRSRAAIPWG